VKPQIIRTEREQLTETWASLDSHREWQQQIVSLCIWWTTYQYYCILFVKTPLYSPAVSYARSFINKL